MFIPSKKAKFGIKIFDLVDPATLYLCNIRVYKGKKNNVSEKNFGEKVKFYIFNSDETFDFKLSTSYLVIFSAKDELS